MPQLTDDDRRIHAFVANWYRTHRGALPAERVADAVGLPCEAVCAAAGVLAVATGVRIARSASPAGGTSGVLFVDAPPTTHRLLDLTGTGPTTADLTGARTRLTS
ncbi:hypothetical protein [Kineococcus glutinatus]|uniref:Uncharacterized protein n=1 Tax=Kineococcus glutinatus TaxID=1070872 RepID=A0ABP9HYN8_9ACTN